jgi:hypothetical protein
LTAIALAVGSRGHYLGSFENCSLKKLRLIDA